MSVLESIKQNLYYHPTMFANRTQVLFYLFTRPGTGYKWQNGQLVTLIDFRSNELRRPHFTDIEDYMASELKQWAASQMMTLNPATPEPPNSAMLTSWRARGLLECARNAQIREQLEQRAATPGLLIEAEDLAARLMRDIGRNIEEVMYPMSIKDANLALIPDDITSDWLEAAEEVACYILEIEGNVFAHGEHETLSHERASLDNRIIAREALVRIQEIKSVRQSQNNH